MLPTLQALAKQRADADARLMAEVQALGSEEQRLQQFYDIEARLIAQVRRLKALVCRRLFVAAVGSKCAAGGLVCALGVAVAQAFCLLL